MAAPRLVAELAIGEGDVTKLIAITRLRTEPASRVARARMLLAYLDARPSLPLVEPCGCIIRRWMTVHGQVRRRRSHPRPRRGLCRWPARKPRISAIHVSCGRRAFLACHARERGPTAGHACLANLPQGSVCKILGH